MEHDLAITEHFYLLQGCVLSVDLVIYFVAGYEFEVEF